MRLSPHPLKIIFLAASMLAVRGLPARAETLETVVVTARPPDPVGSDAFSLVRLDKKAVHAAAQLDAALAQVPGLSLFRRDGSLSANPTTQGVSLRSIAPSGAGRALVMLDGVPQNDPFGGWVIWSALPPEDISGAEIVRGAGAGPYGAGALTGVIALDEAGGSGLVAADASGGARGQYHIAGAGGAGWGGIEWFGSASAEGSNGWIPVGPDQRGAADNAVTLDARNASLRLQAQPLEGTLVSARLGLYQEHRNSGLVGTQSSARGETASLTIARPESDGALGWRWQIWLRDTGFTNSSASIAPGRAFTTPSNDQYATPALGWGTNAAVRGSTSWLDWELGADARLARGESREHFSFISGAFTQGRVSGGKSFVGGFYAEGACHLGDWLLTAGIRADQWSTTNGHLIQTNLSSGAVTLDQHYASRSGVVPTARAGVRRNFGEGFYLRSAAYAGFRAPSLNELYRPFRLGNTVTQANAALTPEKLYGAEIGAGGASGAFSFDATLFWNQLHGAIANVTIAPFTLQRRNAGNIDAYGVEAEARYRLDDTLTLRAAFDLVNARVDGQAQAPQLTGKRPAQAPRWTITGGFSFAPIERLSLDADIRYESARFADDQSLLKLAPATTIRARASWALTDAVAVYVAAENLLNARIATTESADGVISDATPRIFRAGVSFTQ